QLQAGLFVAELAQSDRRQFLLCLAGFADLFCVSMVITCLPIHLKQIGMAPFYMGLFQSEYGAVQIFSSSICGRLVRRFGARNAHSLCCVASAAGYLALGLGPPDFPSLASLRLITALFKHTQTLQRTQLASSPDVSESRWIRLLGSHSTLSSLGFIVGPMVGGVAFDFGGFRLVTGLACVGFLAVGIATAVSAAAPAAEVAPKSS
uniref:MFS domain-containing protein n=1 Tax=Macrostomum lignano TaxID=282301 RepID=A0A1I8I1F4_9PLAT